MILSLILRGTKSNKSIHYAYKYYTYSHNMGGRRSRRDEEGCLFPFLGPAQDPFTEAAITCSDFRRSLEAAISRVPSSSPGSEA